MNKKHILSIFVLTILLGATHQAQAVRHRYKNATEFVVDFTGKYPGCDDVKQNGVKPGLDATFYKGLCSVTQIDAKVHFRYRIIDGKEMPVRPTDVGDDIKTKIIQARGYRNSTGWPAGKGHTTWILGGPLKDSKGNLNKFFITRYIK